MTTMKLNFSKYKKKFISILDYYKNWYQQIDCNPVGQRPAVPDSDNSKKEAVIRAVFWGINLGEITIVKNFVTKVVKYIYDSIDGGHRKRYIWEYMNNKFKVDGKFYNQLTDKQKKCFNNYNLTFVMYEPMNTYTRGYLFRALNESTLVNHQEMLNSFGDTHIANLIRELVRVVEKNNGQNSTSTHSIFEKTYSGTGDSYKFLGFTNDRLFTDELVAQLCFRYTQPKLLGGSPDNELDNMYNTINDNKKLVKKLSKKLNEHLDILFEIAKVRKNLLNDGLSQKDWRLLNYLIFYCKDRCKKFKINDYLSFYKEYKKCLDLILDGKKSQKTQINYSKQISDIDWDSKDRLIKEAFSAYLSVPHDGRKINQSVIWFLDEFEIFKHITILDKKRNYDIKEKESQLSKQKFLCYIDELPLTFAESEAAHKIAHSLGGKTITKNLVMVRKIHNKNMGTVNVEEYKKIYLKQINSKKNLTVNNSPNMAANGHLQHPKEVYSIGT